MHREPSEFDHRVYDAVRMIPRGMVSTYAAVGKVLGCRSPRAIGQALKRNPYASVPCHRVISSSLLIGGFNGGTEGGDIDKKRRMLQSEGVRFDAEDKVEAASLYGFE